MGQAFSEPVTEKESSTTENERFLVSSSSIQGWRISMEDAHTILLSMSEEDDASFFAVFDGHGGAKVANYASENLHKSLHLNQLYRDGHIEEALKNVCIEFDEMMFNDEKMRDELAGSTAVIVLIKNDQIYCANIGDSRAVASFSGQVDPLSIDHKPTCENEMNRIVSAGGWVQFNRVNGNLALSRAFGDFVFKRNEKRSATEQIVIAYPDVQTRTLTSDLEFIVMACDGVWDVMTNAEVVEFIRRRIVYRLKPVAICEELITRCLAPDCQMGCGIGCDNMTVILICYLNGSTYDQFCDRVSSLNPMLPYSEAGSERTIKISSAASAISPHAAIHQQLFDDDDDDNDDDDCDEDDDEDDDDDDDDQNDEDDESSSEETSSINSADENIEQNFHKADLINEPTAKLSNNHIIINNNNFTNKPLNHLQHASNGDSTKKIFHSMLDESRELSSADTVNNNHSTTSSQANRHQITENTATHSLEHSNSIPKLTENSFRLVSPLQSHPTTGISNNNNNRTNSEIPSPSSVSTMMTTTDTATIAATTPTTN